jgi:hypothetical protein
MTTERAVEKLLDQVLALPEWAQVEIVRALIEGRADDYDLHRLDDDLPAAPALSRS